MHTVSLADAHWSQDDIRRSLRVAVALPTSITSLVPQPDFFRSLPAALRSSLTGPSIPR